MSAVREGYIKACDSITNCACRDLSIDYISDFINHSVEDSNCVLALEV